MKTLSYIVSSLALMPFCPIVFLFCFHFCFKRNFEIIRCIVKSLKKEKLKIVFPRQSLGAQTGILVSQMAWILHLILIKNHFSAMT